MLPPEQDITDRAEIWDSMQMLWMDVDPEHELGLIAKVCGQSKYTVEDLGAIYWNEVFPAVKLNLRFGNVIPEWTGFKREWLVERILKTNRYGKRQPFHWLHPYALRWWTRLASEIEIDRARNG